MKTVKRIDRVELEKQLLEKNVELEESVQYVNDASNPQERRRRKLAVFGILYGSRVPFSSTKK